MSRLIEIKIAPKQSALDVVTIEEAKQYCAVDFNDDDGLFVRLIASSRQRLEKYCGRVFLEADCNAIYEQEGCGDRILLSYSDNIVLKAGSAYIPHLVGESYIDTEDRKVILEYTAGYNNNNAPQWMKQAVLTEVAYRYENRGDVKATTGINGETAAFVAPFVKWSLI